MKNRFATRYLLPLEMLVYSQLFIMACSGGFGSGLLHEVLSYHRDNATWLVVIGVLSAAGFLISLEEWCWGRGWDDHRLRLWLCLRKWSALLGMVVCSYAVYTMLAAPGGLRIVAILWGSPVLAAFLAWSWWENYKNETVLDPKLSTDRLERTIVSRRHW